MTQEPADPSRSPSDWKGNWALVTGASSGIGRAYAQHLAAVGMNVVLVARREARLRDLSEELTLTTGSTTRIEALDLENEDTPAHLQSALASSGIRIRLLCNCAAFGRWGRVETHNPMIYSQMLEVNCTALVRMCLAFLPDLASHPTSAIVNVSSPAALQPVPYMAVYAATKAFVHSFSLALYEEWRHKGLRVQTLVPGPTATEFDEIAGAYSSALKHREEPAGAVQASIAKLGADLPVVYRASGTFQQRLFNGLFPAKNVLKAVGKMFYPSDR